MGRLTRWQMVLPQSRGKDIISIRSTKGRSLRQTAAEDGGVLGNGDGAVVKA